ncbi:SWIM zinc finger family protein [Paenibacillus sp. FJAT-26967]|uniref:SWIM zinc finger family protein n=1 Tax=Paenibacillus sp. FJAT-26967 TaxID=1729690 RepID=UPI00083910C8|nr:SWIM zinc finger family protein [Paenibacillus sp. FJAT-26967]
MIQITEAYIDSLAPNSSAIKNAQGLVKKNKYIQLNRSENGELLFGECAGSGSSNYLCSADFIVAEKPVLRCSCPSRQLPCKHTLGLLYAYAGGAAFTEAPVPEDIISKRGKAEKREEKKAKQGEEGAAPKPKKVNKSALKKKLQAQLEGLDLLEKFTESLIRSGLATMDNKKLLTLNEHVKQLGNYYLPEAQTQLRRLALLFMHYEHEQIYTHAMDRLTRIHAFIRKGRAHLNERLADPDLKLDHESTIEEWLGHAWQLSELRDLGLITEQAELIQLSFLSFDDAARLEYVDAGFWLETATGDIHETISYRPHKAAKHMREEDTFFDVAQVKTLYRYPGEMNRRIRFEEMKSRPLAGEDLQAAAAHARRSYADVIKQVKGQLKNPLADTSPVVLLHVHNTLLTDRGEYVITDESGNQIVLGDVLVSLGYESLELLPLLRPELLTDSAMLVMFSHDLDSGCLMAQPLSVIKDKEIVRLLF